MKYTSTVERRGQVEFPEWTGERVYMRPFTKSGGLPKDIERWQRTVDAMLDGIDAPGDIYLMIDQGEIAAGKPHRRPGVHIDGYWIPALAGHGGGGHTYTPPKPKPKNVVGCWGPEPAPRPEWKTGPKWGHATFDSPEAIMLASDVAACRCYEGEWIGPIGEGGDCSSVDVSTLHTIYCEPHAAYAGNVTMLHESLPVATDCRRTLVRLNIPGWTP